MLEDGYVTKPDCKEKEVVMATVKKRERNLRWAEVGYYLPAKKGSPNKCLEPGHKSA